MPATAPPPAPPPALPAPRPLLLPDTVPAADLAQTLDVSVAAVELAREAELVDLHIDTFIPPRLWGYDPLQRHQRALLGRAFFGHLDLPRMADGGLTGAMWSITTNPFRSAAGRWRSFLANLASFQTLVAASGGSLAICGDHAAYRAARSRGAHAVLLSIQGANALDAAPDGWQSIPDERVLRATLVHLTSSGLGATNSPLSALRRDKHLTAAGYRLVEQMNAARAFVDLAHIHPVSFDDVVATHDPTQPLIATHTGVAGVRPHWRNLSDDRLRAIADTGGVVGVIFSTSFLSRPGGPTDGAMVVEHMEHIERVAGEGAVALGSDLDGAIVPPADLWGGECYPRLVQHMLDRRWSERRIRAALGENFLRAFAELRPGAPAAARSTGRGEHAAEDAG